MEWARRLAWFAARSIELLLAVGGLAYTLVGSDNEGAQALFLALWVCVALLYLLIGGAIARHRRRPGAPRPEPRMGRRLSFFLSAAASLTGLGAALDVLFEPGDNDLSGLVTALGVLAMISAWLLLHIGYARFYATWPEDFDFPGGGPPGLVDYLYFSFTVAVSFAASDVSVRTRPLRWHVMVHSVVSFFYNAIVLAVAVGVITQK
ncbi:DUF1345 domain-containing protein [Hamadaea tsunoensis]|uniref:DUF1345 domain-containing protein n=1 Tax=Hamadaea tsunoensis TaxID=53368 RepID=UPI0004087F5B|nr:DUF1345 domain-containing protein [Hamadaea tsunoensis]